MTVLDHTNFIQGSVTTKYKGDKSEVFYFPWICEKGRWMIAHSLGEFQTHGSHDSEGNFIDSHKEVRVTQGVKVLGRITDPSLYNQNEVTIRIKLSAKAKEGLPPEERKTRKKKQKKSYTSHTFTCAEVHESFTSVQASMTDRGFRKLLRGCYRSGKKPTFKTYADEMKWRQDNYTKHAARG